jgi:guanylate kinase
MSENKKAGRLMVFSGPSGVGKGTVLFNLLKTEEKLRFSVSATTRRPRAGETNKVHYYFISKEEFEENIRRGEMLEWAEYNGNYYGTPRVGVEGWLSAGYDVVLDIDVAGAMQIKQAVPDALLVFMLPPSMEALKHRLSRRDTEDADVIAERLKIARREMEYISKYEYIVINDDIDEAVERIRVITRAEKYKYKNMQKEIEEVLKDA